MLYSMRVNVTSPESGRRSEVELPLSDRELTKYMWSIGIKETIPTVILTNVLDKNSPLKPLEGKRIKIDELNFLAKRMEILTDYEQKKLMACCEVMQADNLKDMINLTYSLDGVSLIDDYKDIVAIGRRIYLDINSGITESEISGMDFGKYARDYMNQVPGRQTIYGKLLPCDISIRQVYDGQIYPRFFYDMNIVISMTVQSADGLEDYLYLPTDICSLNKVKERLGVNYFAECTISEMQNHKLPDEIYQTIKVDSIQELTLLNEMCSTISKFNESQMIQFQMVLEYANTTDYAAMTSLAKNLKTFEIIPGVYDDKDYGRFIIEKSGLFDVDELLLPFIDYEGFAHSKREATLLSGGYVSGGFVGVSQDIGTLMDYAGEYSDPLEIIEEEQITFRLFSPLWAQLFEEGQEKEVEIYGEELAETAQDIQEMIDRQVQASEIPRGLMTYFHKSREISAKVLSAFPAVEIHEGILYGVLECQLKSPLSEEELQILKDDWLGQMSDGWGEGFEQQEIRTQEGSLFVHFWGAENDFSIWTESELKGVNETQIQNSMSQSM